MLPRLLTSCTHRCLGNLTTNVFVGSRLGVPVRQNARCPARQQRRRLVCTSCAVAGVKSTDRLSKGIVTSCTNSRFPFKDEFEFDGRSLCAEEVLQMLGPFLTDGRLLKARAVVDDRSFNLLPIVETLYDVGNLAAVCRSADALGFGAVHAIDNNISYKESKRTSAGAEKWLDIKLWDNPTECLTAAKAAGFRVLATHLQADAVPVSEVDWTVPTAVLFGNEKDGVSKESLSMADGCVVIPMSGFVDSFNISVAAALLMYEARRQRVATLGRGTNGDLTEQEKRVLQAVFALRTKGRAKMYVQELLDRDLRVKRSPRMLSRRHKRQQWQQERDALEGVVGR